MDKGRRTFLLFVWTGGILWLLVTVTALLEVARSPSDHVGLALGLLAIWLLLLVFAALTRLTEYIGGHH